MTLRMTEEEFEEWQQRCTPATPAQIADYHRRHSPLPDTIDSRAIASSYGFGVPLPSNPPKRSKYGNRKVEIDGMKFDSQHEANVYGDLMLRVRAGELKTVLRQVSFDLPGNIRYVADFVAITPDMRIEGVYDAKSEATKKNRVYINKKKQMRACYGIEIREV